MTKLRNPFRLLVHWLGGEQARQSYSSRAYVREWHRRQREALRQAGEADISGDH